MKRHQAFEENIRLIKEYNQKFDEGIYTFKMAPNDLADLVYFFFML